MAPAGRTAAAILAALIVGVPVALAQPRDVLERFNTAVAAGDVDGAVALFHADASMTVQRNGCIPCTLPGIRLNILRRVYNMTAFVTASVEVDGDFVTARIERRSDPTRAAGVDRVIELRWIEIRGDLIVSYREDLDTNDAETERFLHSPHHL